jgi:micrococcal nuclease
MYVYRHVTVERVIDGDSVVLAIDLGNKIIWRDNFRLMGIDAPERGQPGYVEASLFLAQTLENNLSRVETHKADKFGRWLVDLYIGVEGGELHVNTLMLVEKHAKEYDGGRKSI